MRRGRGYLRGLLPEGEAGLGYDIHPFRALLADIGLPHDGQVPPAADIRFLYGVGLGEDRVSECCSVTCVITAELHR